MGDIYDALVELITNADDSYNRLYQKQRIPKDGGDILVEHLAQRGSSSQIIVRDRAEGMDIATMQETLAKIGQVTSESGNRGYYGRGAKDCTELGDVVFESIKDERYFRSRITHDLKFVIEATGERATDEKRKELHLRKRQNGTSVTIQLLPGKPLPRYQTLRSDLPWHYSLRDIMVQDSPSTVKLRNLNNGASQAEQLVYRPPEGELVVDESFEVEGYPDSSARLRIWRAKTMLDDSKKRFEQCGILIKGERGIYDCSLISEDIKKDPNARLYYGRLECPYIDNLLQEFELRRREGEAHSDENPRLVIDPNRRSGLDLTHPFTTHLFKIPRERLRALLAKDREREKGRQKEVADAEMKKRLNRLAKLASRFMQDRLDEISEIGEGNVIDPDAFVKTGFILIPSAFSLGIQKERTVTCYVRREALKNEQEEVNITCDSSDALEIMGKTIQLHPHKKRHDRLVGTFRLKGLSAKENVEVVATCNGLPPTSALVDVKEVGAELRDFDEPLEFEHSTYRIRQNRTRVLRLFAKYPEVVSTETDIVVSISDQSSAAIKGRCVMVPVTDSNYAVAEIRVEGRKLGSRSKISAEVNEQAASANIRVTQEEEEKGIPFDFKLMPEASYGTYRAMWNERENKPYQLLIAARHPSVARYLGDQDSDGNWPGQKSPLFRTVLAEIIADSVCTKALRAEAQERPYDFPWAEEKEPYSIADSVLFEIQKRIRDFIGDAHKIMLSDSEIPQEDA